MTILGPCTIRSSLAPVEDFVSGADQAHAYPHTHIHTHPVGDWRPLGRGGGHDAGYAACQPLQATRRRRRGHQTTTMMRPLGYEASPPPVSREIKPKPDSSRANPPDSAPCLGSAPHAAAAAIWTLRLPPSHAAIPNGRGRPL